MAARPSAPASSYKDRIIAKTSRYAPSDLAEVADFRSAMYGEGAFLASERYLRWMFDDEHTPPQRRSTMWLFRADGRLEAQQAGLRTSIRVAGSTYEAMWASDLFVSPKYQLRGVGAVLSELVTEEAPITLGVEVSDAARKSFLRSGWTDLGHVPLFVHPIDVAVVAAAHDSHGPNVAKALNPLLRAADVCAMTLARLSRFRLRPIETFDRRADQIWHSVSRHYAVICRRDAETLNWRYTRFPEPGFYRCFYLERAGRAVGYVVTRSGHHNGLTSTHVVDFLCAPRHVLPLLVASVDQARRSGSQAVYCMHPQGRLSRAFRIAGFFRRTTGWPLMVKTNDVPAEAQQALSDPAQWFLTSGDSNIDHPREGTVFASS